jgi:hypothetical protein
MPIRTTKAPVPRTMKAAAIDRYGPPSVLKLRDLPTPEPEPDQVLIAVHTAGVGGWDAEIRAGEWPPPGRASASRSCWGWTAQEPSLRRGRA